MEISINSVEMATKAMDTLWFLGPYKNKIFFTFVDTTTKWLYVFPVNSTTAQTVTTKLSEVFARFGIARTITSDGAKCFRGT